MFSELCKTVRETENWLQIRIKQDKISYSKMFIDNM